MITASQGLSDTPDPRLLRGLGEIVGTRHVLVEPDVIASYGLDWTRRFQGKPMAVIRPG